jgi:chromosome segregation ATPase
MDINQAARMIEWLDEERRKDKSTIARLEERLAQQQENVDQLLRRINSMESDQTVLRSQMGPNIREADILDQMRKEINQMIESVEAKRLTAEREAERRAELARESMLRPIREITDKIQRVERQTSEIPAVNIERDRLSTSVSAIQQRIDDLYKKLEEPDRRLAFLEEQRRQDARRISEVQSEIPELQKQIDSIRPKITLLEDLALRIERRVQEVQNAERERRDQIQQFIDQQTLLVQQRDIQIDELVKRFGEQEGIMQRNIERFETWAEAYRGMKKIIDDFERIGERLERRISEVAEMQRLSEERFRQEWNDWSSDDQKRWKQFTLSNDEAWRNHDKEFDRFIKHMTEIEAWFPPIQDAVNRLWNLERERAQLYRERYQSLLHEHDTGKTITTTQSMPPVVLNNNGDNGTTG